VEAIFQPGRKAMLTKEEIQGGWTQMKGKIKEVWGQINDDELLDFKGDFEQLVGMIHSQTGQSKQEIEKQLNEIDSQMRPMLAQAKQAAMQYVDQTKQKAQEVAGQVRDGIAHGHEGAQEMVRNRPMESLAGAFGIGLIAGLVVGLVMRSR
jgi:uncharacterized protein YjbJ (UPF0337 family)